MVLAETVGSIAAMFQAGEGRAAVGIEISATHHRSARTGWVTGTATPLHQGRTLATYQIEVVDDEGRRVCTSRLTCMLQGPAELLTRKLTQQPQRSLPLGAEGPW